LRGSIYKDKDITGLLGYLRKKLLIPVLYKRANKVVALSNGLKEELIQFTGISDKKLLVIYNHYDFNELIQQVQQPLSELNKKIFNKRVIITSGRLHQSKGHREFLKVFAKLRVATDSRFVIFGDGDLRAELIQEAKNLDLSTYDVWSNMEFTEKHDVYFMGYIKDPFNFIASSTLFVFPSLYEGLGNSLVEALACSVPIVAADCHSGPREVLAPSTNPNFNLTTADFAEYGVLMPVLNNNSSTTIWVDVIAKLLQDDVLRKQYSSKTLTRLKDFSIKSISHQWSALLAEDSAK
jgi:glycosyltransferase involved in cell wall biosynthesis